MAERHVVIDKLRLNYEGLFKVTDLYKTVDNWLREKGYDKREKMMAESVTKGGKYVEWIMEPWKKITDYATIVIKLRVILTDIQEVEVEIDNQKVNMNQGKARFVFDGYIETDYESKWESKPLFFFLRTIMDKYIFKPYTVGFDSNAASDINDLNMRIKSFLNLYRYSGVAYTKPGFTFPDL